MTLENKLKMFAAAAAFAIGTMYAVGCEEEESYCCEHEGHTCPYNNVCVDDAASGQSTKHLSVRRPDGTLETCDCVYSPADDGQDHGYGLLDDCMTVEEAAEHSFRTAEMRSL
jgi:hypothetical protein